MATDACTENTATSDATGNSSPIEESAEASLQRMGPDLAAKVIRAFTQCQSQAAAETSAQDAAIKAMKDLLPNGVHDSVVSKISVYLTSMWQTSDSRFTDDWGVHSITFNRNAPLPAKLIGVHQSSRRTTSAVWGCGHMKPLKLYNSGEGDSTIATTNAYLKQHSVVYSDGSKSDGKKKGTSAFCVLVLSTSR